MPGIDFARAAPSRDVEADARKHFGRIASEHAEPHDADAQRARGPLQLRRPELPRWLSA